MADDDITTLDEEQGLSLDPISLTFGAGGGTQTVGVSAVGATSLSWEVEGSSLPDWLSVDPSSGVASDAETPVHVTAQENTSLSRIEGIIFSDGAGGAATLIVRQDGRDGEDVPVIRVTPGSVSFAYGGGSETLTVLCNDGDIWYVDGDTVPEWCAVIPINGSPGGHTNLTVLENVSASSRDCEIRFYTERGAEATVGVTQEGVPVEPAISVEPESLEFPPEGGESSRVTVTSSDGTAYVDGLPSWLAVGSQVGLILYFTAEGNTGAVSRAGQVRIYNDAGAEAWLNVSQESAYRLAHFGEFPDIRGNVWRVEILRCDGWTGEAAELAFPADSPLVIEWPSINFEDVMWGSSATLKVVSPGDRTYIDLYTIEPGSIRLDVYRDGSLYWSGMLDPEFYEEPYEHLSGYEVELTFTDFGILDRLRYDLSGIQKIYDVISHAVEVSRIHVESISRSISIYPLTGVCVNSENFTDEEGNVSTMYEAVEGILKPLGVRMCQRGGQILLFDIIGILDRYDYGETAGEVVWAGDSQTLGVDRVYNSVTVTFSPYAVSGLADSAAVEYGGKYDADHTNTTSYPAEPTDPDYGDYYSFWTAGTTRIETDFTIFLSDKGAGVASLPTVWSSYYTYNGGRYFHILPVLGSVDECTGVLVSFRPYANNYNTLVGGTLITRYSAGMSIYTSERVWLPPTSETVAARYKVRIEVPMLLDARQNPWDGDDPQTDNQETLEKDCRWVFLNAAITLYDDDGNAVSHYVNSGRAEGSSAGDFGGGSWEDGAGGSLDCWLEWYDPADPEGTAGIGGWKSNRHCVGRPDGGGDRVKYSPLRNFQQVADGEYLPYPASGGWLEVKLYGGLNGYRWNEAVDFRATSGTAWDNDAIYGWDKPNDYVLEPATIIRWWLVKAPTVEIVMNSLTMEAADCEDVEYRGTLNASAQDDLSIDTICGTCDGAPVTARGLFLNSDGTQVTDLYRDRDGGGPARLLINQLYSQYAGRKTVLSGEAEIPGTLVLTERNQEDKTFILTGDTQDIRMGTSEIEVREIGTDTYKGE